MAFAETTDFFPTAAQVIPVVLVAMYVEERVFDTTNAPATGAQGSYRRSDRLMALGVLLVLLFAEWTAVFALYEPDAATKTARSVVVAALALGLFWLVLKAISRLLWESAPTWGGRLYVIAIAVYGLMTLVIDHDDLVPLFGIGLFGVATLASVVVGVIDDRRQQAASGNPPASPSGGAPPPANP